MAGDQDILTVKELCDLLRVHPATVYKMARKGKIPGFRVGTEWPMTPRIVAKASCQNGSKVLTALASYPCIALRRTTTI